MTDAAALTCQPLAWILDGGAKSLKINEMEKP